MKVVAVALNFAIPAGYHGRIATVPSGTKIVFTTAQTELQIVGPGLLE